MSWINLIVFWRTKLPIDQAHLAADVRAYEPSRMRKAKAFGVNVLGNTVAAFNRSRRRSHPLT
jgi:hypothetical protein